MTKRKSPPTRAGALADFWRVHLRTAQRWLAEPGRGSCPPAAALDDPGAMVAWVRSLPTASQAKLTPAFRARIDAFRIALERGQPIERPAGAALPPPPSGQAAAHATAQEGLPDDPHFTAFLADRAAAAAAAPAPGAPTTTPDQQRLAALKLPFDYATHRVLLAQRRGDHAACREWTDTAARLAGVIHDEELRAQRLGRETGDMLPWPEVERILRALPYWLLRGTDDLLTTLCPRLAAATAAPLYPEEVRRLLEPALLAARLLTPLTRAAQVNAGTALPERAIAALREALAATLEDGAALFDTLYATPVPPPVTPPIPGGPTSASAAPNPSILQVTEASSGPPAAASAAPSVSVPTGHEPAGGATASHSQPGSVSAQTA